MRPARGFGGGIEDNSSGALTVTNSTFDANKAIAVGPNAPDSRHVPATSSHWAVPSTFHSVSTGPATISNSTFTGNEALGGSPGASAGGGALSNSQQRVVRP